jgi:NAD+ kinase
MRVKSAVLFVNLNKENAGPAAAEIRRELENREINVTVFSFDRSNSGSTPVGKWDIAFTLGGDGTVLCAARILAGRGTPLIPLQLGTLGFIANVEKHDWLSVYTNWLNGTAQISSRCMLNLVVSRKGDAVYNNTCLNDIVISSLGIAKLIRLKVETEVAQGADLGYYRSDGLIIATPTGSTAYSMAAGGPILDPEMEAQILTPICPFTLSNRPLVLPSRQVLFITVEEEQRSGVLLTVDGQDTFQLNPGDKITICHSPHYARLITAGRTAYYSALQKKLAFGSASERGTASKGGEYA